MYAAFKMTDGGDFVIDSVGNFTIIKGEDVIAHKVWLTISTDVGEYKYLPDNGIVYNNILRKHKSQALAIDAIKSEIRRALYYHDEKAVLETCDVSIDEKSRNAQVYYVATMDGGIIKGEVLF